MQQTAVLIGCGARGQAHARALADSDRFDFVAVCDLQEELARETAAEFDVDRTYTDLDEAIAAVEPVHVSAVTPPTIRASIVEEVLEHDVDSMLVEKPVANDLGETEEIATLAHDAGVRVTVCHETLWADEIRAVADWIDGERLGEIERLVGTTKGGLAAQGTHFLHMLDWLLDDAPTAVRAHAQGPTSLDPQRNERCPDHSEPTDTLLEIEYDDARAFCHFGPSAPDETAQADTFWLEYRLDVVGSKGHARFVHGDHARGMFADGTTETVDARDFDEDAYMTRGLYDDLAATLAGERDDHPADLASALATHRTIDAAMRSAIEGRAIPPARNPPAVGPPTGERLRRGLAARAPLSVSTLMYMDQDREEALDALVRLGAESVDVWSMSAFAKHLDPDRGDPGAIRSELDARGLDAPVVSVYDDGDVEAKLSLASGIGAEAVVMAGRTPERPETWEPDRLEGWLDTAAERDLTLAFENHLDTLETVDEMAALLDALDHPAAGICLAPTHLWLAGERAEEALIRLGDAIEVLYLWDMEPGATREDAEDIWWDRADSQVPGGGGAVDVERLLDLAVEYCPEAHWTVCYHGTEEWDRDRIDESVRRALRYVERRRP